MTDTKFCKPMICLVGLTPLERYELIQKIESVFKGRFKIIEAPEGCGVECSKCLLAVDCYHPELMILGRTAIEKGVAPEAPFIAMFAEEDGEMATKAAHLGADAYIPPRCSEARLRTTITMVAEKKGHSIKRLAPVMAKLQAIKEEESSKQRVEA